MVQGHTTVTGNELMTCSYTVTVFLATAVQVNSASARRRPAAPNPLASSGAQRSWLTRSAIPPGKGVGVLRAAEVVAAGLERHQETGLAVLHDLGYPAHGAGHHGHAAGHGFDVDQAERLVDGRADENGGRGS